MKKVDELIFKVLCWLCSGLMFGMMVVICAQVFYRYVIDVPLPWSEELGRYIFIWMSFLGIAAAYYKGSHVAFDLLQSKLQGAAKKGLMVVLDLLTIALSVGLISGGSAMVQLGTLQRSPALSLPMQFVFSVIPISGGIMLYFALRKLVSRKDGI